MNSTLATRSAWLELREEMHSMREGYTFLDEKCLLLAGATLRELQRFEQIWQQYRAQAERAQRSLDAALGRHGLDGLTHYPLAEPDDDAALTVRTQSVMGVTLVEASGQQPPPAPRWPEVRTPEAAACAQAYANWLQSAIQLAAVSGNLERLYAEYRRTARRARALDSVLLPELASAVAVIGGELEELEREDAILMRGRTG